MSRLLIQSHHEFEQYLGKKLGSSEFHTVTQEQIDQFADATMDHQWIHTDPKRAKSQGAFGSTIAHGYLTLSLIPHMWEQIVTVTNYKMLVNYGIDQFKFGNPVLVNSRIRIHSWLKECTDLRGISRIKLKIEMEIEGDKKPAFSGFFSFIYHFNN